MTDAAAQSEDELEACFQCTRARFEARGLSLTRLSTAPDRCLRLQIPGLRCEWTLDVDCTWPRTTKLPNVHLRAPQDLLAHVGYSGLVCVTDSQGLSLDQNRQADVVAQTVLDAFDLLEQSAADAATDLREFFNELEGYWAGLPRWDGGRSSVEVDLTDRLVTSYVDHSGKRAFWYFTERGGPIPPEFPVARLAKMRALYAVLDTPMPPPKPGEELESGHVKSLWAMFSPAQKALWQQLTSGTSKKQHKLLSMLLSVPRAAGGHSLIGMSFYVRGRQVDTSGSATPIAVFRHTATYMRERGGAMTTAFTKHVVVFGCGAVGSEVADALVSSGVGHLTLVDPDLMSEDNVFRHALGRNWIGWHKVVALREELMRKYPGVEVDATKVEAQEWLATGDLSKVDGVVVALGQPTLERSLSRRIREAGRAIPLVFTWLEPLDLGGHSLLFSATGEGCLDCLYRDEEGQTLWHRKPRSSHRASRSHAILRGVAASSYPTAQSNRVAPLCLLRSRCCEHSTALPLLDIRSGSERALRRRHKASAQHRGGCAPRQSLPQTPRSSCSARHAGTAGVDRETGVYRVAGSASHLRR